MTARTHDLAAFTGLVAVIAYLPLPAINLSTLLLGLLLNQIGGIVPDVDQPAAPLWRNLPIGRFIGKLWAAAWADIDFIPLPAWSRCLALCCAWFWAT